MGAGLLRWSGRVPCIHLTQGAEAIQRQCDADRADKQRNMMSSTTCAYPALTPTIHGHRSVMQASYGRKA